MKIVHFCLSCFYIDGYAYQENELVAQNVIDGHDVVVIASTETFGTDKRISYVEPDEYKGSDGARVIRIPYRRMLPHKVMRKLRTYPGVYRLLEQEAPDVILFHGLSAWELITVAKYKHINPNVKLYADTHQDSNNSARTFASKYLLHANYYRRIVHGCLSAIDKVFCVSVDCIDFMKNFYKVPEEILEFFPLGGRVLSDEEYYDVRMTTRDQYSIEKDEVLFVQTGKIDRSKKLLDSLQALGAVNNPTFRFVIAGHLQDEISQEVESYIAQDSRISYVGWKQPDELRNLLCAADVYVQPGTQSATMQMSLCCRCVVILDDVMSHEPYLDGNGWLVGGELSLEQAFHEVAKSTDRLPQMSRISAEIASRLLDYKSLAARLYR